MSWLQLSVDCAEGAVDALSDGFTERGALSVTVQNAGGADVLEPAPGEAPSWRLSRLSALFDAHADVIGIRGWLSGVLSPDQFSTLDVSFVDDQDWLNSWRAHAVEACFGDRLWVAARDVKLPAAAPNQAVLRLDPGLAFGTGAHPTTRLCLEWLARSPRRDQCVLDFGCGSGILAIAAALLGARPVVAVDHDPQAIIATMENAAYNQVMDHMRVLLPQAAPPDQEFDLVLANILANPLVALAPRLSAQTRSGGTLVLAGLLRHQVTIVEDAYPDFEFLSPEASNSDQDWVRLVGRKRSSTGHLESTADG